VTASSPSVSAASPEPPVKLSQPEAAVEDEIDAEDDLDVEPTEAYCVKCKMKVEMEDPEPVWTSRGQPATRGSCPVCGTTVFRIGKTPAHENLRPPPPVRVEDVPKIVANRGRKKALPATFINAGDADSEFAARLAKELDNAGVHTYYDPGSVAEQVNWAGGIHPALRDCVKMVVILSKASAGSEKIQKAWSFFKGARKPIVVALLDSDAEVPDALRRSPRFDLSKEYKPAFRQMMQTLSDL
jgi:hypothetical protein